MSEEAITEESVLETLKTVSYPGYSRDIVSFGLVKGVAVSGKDVAVRLSVSTRDPKMPEQIYKDCKEALHNLTGGQVNVDIDVTEPDAPSGAAEIGKAVIPGVKNIIAVASGKGGVGKSTVSTNLAVALQQRGNAVGICDCDLYGPSIAHMFGSNQRPGATEQNEIIPIESAGLKLISMGFLLEEDSPVIVRGPLATRYTQQFLRQVLWGELDYLILDLPPGTGDIQLTIVQTVALTGALIVTTPQEIALLDARKAVSMFKKVNVPVLGIIENMSYFRCPGDGERYYIFGQGGGAAEAERQGVPLIGEVPIDINTRESGDTGHPVAREKPDDSPVSAEFNRIASAVEKIVPVVGQ